MVNLEAMNRGTQQKGDPYTGHGKSLIFPRGRRTRLGNLFLLGPDREGVWEVYFKDLWGKSEVLCG